VFDYDDVMHQEGRLKPELTCVLWWWWWWWWWTITTIWERHPKSYPPTTPHPAL